MTTYPIKELELELMTHCMSNDHDRSNYIKEFISQKTNIDRVNFVYKDMQKYKIYPRMVKNSKNDRKANDLRETGNRHFAFGNYSEALESYTKSLITAETRPTKALAYANRSACLFKLGRFQECIIDIDRAFENDYPEQSKPKLVTRRAQAEKLQKPIERYHEDIPVIPPNLRNSKIQCASNCVAIEEKEEFGRCVVATRTIEIGEIVSVERAFGYAIRTGRLVHCHDCLELCYNPLPCDGCTEVVFCSETCKMKAQSYHKYECILFDTLLETGIELILVAFKVALLAKYDYNQLNTYKFHKNEYYQSDRYKEIHCLKAKPMTYFNNEQYMQVVTVAAVFHLLKTNSDFFQDQFEDGFKEVMLLQLQVIPLNGMPISEYTYIPGSGYKAEQFAYAIFAFSSLFNHSCGRYLNRTSYGTSVVIHANHQIKKGEQCFINYGPHYDSFPKIYRQLQLSVNYLFTCKCVACEDDWQGCTAQFSKVMNLPESSQKLYEMHVKISEADLEFAKEMLPFFLKKLKKCEQSEPWGDSLSLKKVISHCYKTFGNKRRI